MCVFHHICEIPHVSTSSSPTQGFEPARELGSAHKSSTPNAEE